MSPALKLQQALEADLFDAVRLGFETVAGMARHVKIRADRLNAYALSLPPKPQAAVFDDEHHYIGADDESAAAYVLCLDSINFGSGYFPHLVAEGWQIIDGGIYYSLSTRLKRRFEESVPYTAAQLIEMSVEECGKMLDIDPAAGAFSREFLDICAASLRDLGRLVQRDHGGLFMTMVDQAAGSSEKMLRALLRIPHFNDVHEFRGLPIPFYKRAQITVADLHLAFKRCGKTLFHDIDRLTMFPDNGVPHVLHLDGILEYTPELAQKITNGVEILSGSEEEIEIRACAGHVVELLAVRKNLIAMDIDHILWHRSADDPKYRDTPAHRTLSRFY